MPTGRHTTSPKRKALLLTLCLLVVFTGVRVALAQEETGPEDSAPQIEFSSTETAKRAQRLREEAELFRAELERANAKLDLEKKEKERRQVDIPTADSKVLEDHGYDIEGDLYQPKLMVYRSLDLAAQQLATKVEADTTGGSGFSGFLVVESNQELRDSIALYYMTKLTLYDLASLYKLLLTSTRGSSSTGPLDFNAGTEVNQVLDILTGTALNVADLFAVFRQKIKLKAITTNLDEEAARLAVANSLRGVAAVRSLDSTYPIRVGTPKPLYTSQVSELDMTAFGRAPVEVQLYTVTKLRGEGNIKALAVQEKLAALLKLKVAQTEAEQTASEAKRALEEAEKKFKAEPNNTDLQKAFKKAEDTKKTADSELSVAKAAWAKAEGDVKVLERSLALLERLNGAVDKLMGELIDGGLARLMTLEEALPLVASDVAANINPAFRPRNPDVPPAPSPSATPATPELDKSNAAIVSVVPVMSGADQRIVSNLFNSGSLSFSSGVVLKYSVAKLDGTVLSSGVIYEMTGYQRSKDRPGRFPE